MFGTRGLSKVTTEEEHYLTKCVINAVFENRMEVTRCQTYILELNNRRPLNDSIEGSLMIRTKDVITSDDTGTTWSE